MKKRRVISITIGVIVLAFVMINWFSSGHDPKYHGIKLSEWFERYYISGNNSPREDKERHQEAVRAIRALGTNAVPFLLEECFSNNEDSSFRSNALKILCELPSPFHFPPFVPAGEIREAAAEAIFEVKPPADLILPRATDAMAETNGLRRRMGIYLLGGLGDGAERATPWLLQALRSSDQWEKNLSLMAVEHLGQPAKDLLPEITSQLTNRMNGRGMIWFACHALGKLGSNAAPAIPVLKEELLKTTNLHLRMTIAGALCRIESNESSALTEVINEIRNSGEKQQRRGLIYQLGEIGTNACSIAMPYLLEILGEKDLEAWHMAATTLHKIGAAKSAVLPPLLERLTSQDERIRYSAADVVLQFDPENSEALAVLLDLIKTESSYRAPAFDRLGMLGPAAKAAVPTLRKLRANKEQSVREAAEKALKRIQVSFP